MAGLGRLLPVPSRERISFPALARYREAAVRLGCRRIPGCGAGCWGSPVLDLDPHVSMVDFNNRSLGFLIRKMEEQCLWRLAWRVPEAGKGSHAWGVVEDCARGQGASQGPAGGTPGDLGSPQVTHFSILPTDSAQLRGLVHRTWEGWGWEEKN